MWERVEPDYGPDCNDDMNNLGYDCTNNPDDHQEEVELHFDAYFDMCALIILEHFCTRLAPQLLNTDGTFTYEYTVGDAKLQIPVPTTYRNAGCTAQATVSCSSNNNVMSKNGSNFEVEITDPATFPNYGTYDGEITTVTISDDGGASQDIYIKILNPCFATTLVSSTFPALDPTGYTVY